ncbi:MAG TPA: putative lipid II flippase FtsW [Candidatus Sulfotelmatobacter sp.]|nr:putative lipid II flippase FtsW [Candidatus Sulfotelmatobacter sp.]
MPRTLEPDRQLFGATLGLCLVGAVMVFSASAITAGQLTGNGYIFLLRQLLWMALGITGMFGLMNLDYRNLRQPRVIFPGLAVTLVLLVAVIFFDRTHQTHRWIRVGPMNLQPSEIAKLVAILYLAWFLEIRLAPRGAGVDDFRRTLLPALGTVTAIASLILIEPDLGTACMVLLIAFVMLFVSGLSLRYIAGMALAAIPAVAILIFTAPYRLERAKAFFSPGSDPQGHGFQLLQSLIAVGSGGFTGVGLMESRQKLFYLPEAHTDFIFAVIAEELGFIGAAIVLGLFALYGWRGFIAAMKAPDRFGRLLGVGITTMVVGQALVNLSVVLGMMPTKGIPLPFISYGGSSLLGMLLATGVLLNISQHAEHT